MIHGNVEKHWIWAGWEIYADIALILTYISEIISKAFVSHLCTRLNLQSCAMNAQHPQKNLNVNSEE